MIDELLDLFHRDESQAAAAPGAHRDATNGPGRPSKAFVPTGRKKDLTVTFVPTTSPVELEIDPARLAQVLTNLMTNAIKYTDPKGQITVRLTSRDDGRAHRRHRYGHRA